MTNFKNKAGDGLSILSAIPPCLGFKEVACMQITLIPLIIDELIAFLLLQDFKCSKSLILMKFNYADFRQIKLKNNPNW